MAIHSHLQFHFTPSLALVLSHYPSLIYFPPVHLDVTLARVSAEGRKPVNQSSQDEYNNKLREKTGERRKRRARRKVVSVPIAVPQVALVALSVLGLLVQGLLVQGLIRGPSHLLVGRY
jgi:hypothetical protein